MTDLASALVEVPVDRMNELAAIVSSAGPKPEGVATSKAAMAALAALVAQCPGVASAVGDDHRLRVRASNTKVGELDGAHSLPYVFEALGIPYRSGADPFAWEREQADARAAARRAVLAADRFDATQEGRSGFEVGGFDVEVDVEHLYSRHSDRPQPRMTLRIWASLADGSVSVLRPVSLQHRNVPVTKCELLEEALAMLGYGFDEWSDEGELSCWRTSPTAQRISLFKSMGRDAGHGARLNR